MSLGAASQSVAAATQSVSNPLMNAGSANGAPRDKDRAEAQTAPQFGELLQNIQSKYGARPEKAREIKKTLGKDDFLRIMITQMKNQDPTKPFNAEQMATQMAQFTTIEQLKNMNDSLTKMTAPNQPVERMAMTSMIGKTITVDRGRFPHTEGQNDQISYGLPKDAAQVKVTLINEHGETVLEKDLGKVKMGESTFTWDGNKSNSLPAKAGTYMIKVDAKDQDGNHIETSSQSTGRVIGVSFEGGEPVFLMGDARHQDKVTMKNIVRIDDVGGANPLGAGEPAASGAPNGSIHSAEAPKTPPAFFNFQKGVGSQNLDSGALPPEAQRALSGYQGQGAQAARAPVAGGGFPNGLSNDSQTGDNKGREVK
jgi:flagellar hook assembly protein FlgD